MCQSPSIIHLFWCAGLRRKIEEAITSLKEENGEELSKLVQFIGASNLCGIRIPRLQLTDLTLQRIESLPCKILPHEPGHVKVERWQRQLWIGLRTIATLSSMPIPVDLSALNKTYELWKANEEETRAEPDQLPHRINQSMIKWLEDCLKHGGKELVASKEPLWFLVGFPKNIAMFRRDI